MYIDKEFFETWMRRIMESDVLAFIKNHFDDRDCMKDNKNNENNTESLVTF